MVIKFRGEFERALLNIIDFISNDSKSKAQKFATELKKEIEKVTFMPYSHRQNFDANNKNVRDLIFKGYVIPYHINNETSTITILFIYKENQPKIDFKE